MADLTSAEIIERFKLRPTAEDLQEAGRLCTKFMARLNGHKPEPREVVAIFEGIFNAGRALGAIQCRRSIVDAIVAMEEPAAPPAPGPAQPAPGYPGANADPPYPPPVIVNAIDREFCAECAKEAS